MRICAAWQFKHGSPVCRLIHYGKPLVFSSGRFSLTPILRRLGRSFLVHTRSFTSARTTQHAARRDAAKGALEHAQKLQPNSPETLLALGYYQYWVLRDYGVAKTTFERVSKMLPNNSDVPRALALITRREGNWDESVAYVERGLALDPRQRAVTESSGIHLRDASPIPDSAKALRSSAGFASQ